MVEAVRGEQGLEVGAAAEEAAVAAGLAAVGLVAGVDSGSEAAAGWG